MSNYQTPEEKKSLTLKARSAAIAHQYGVSRGSSPTAGPAFLFEQAATPTVVLALLDELYELKKSSREALAELGELYATVFRDGGHRQAELDALGPLAAADFDAADVFNTEPSRWPRRYAAAVDVLTAVRIRAERYDGLCK